MEKYLIGAAGEQGSYGIAKPDDLSQVCIVHE